MTKQRKAAQALLIAAGFTLHARTRWPNLKQWRTPDHPELGVTVWDGEAGRVNWAIVRDGGRSDTHGQGAEALAAALNSL